MCREAQKSCVIDLLDFSNCGGEKKKISHDYVVINSAYPKLLLFFFSPLQIPRGQKYVARYPVHTTGILKKSPLKDLSLRQHVAAKTVSCRVSKGIPCKESRFLPAVLTEQLSGITRAAAG